MMKKIFSKENARDLILNLIGTAILAFGLYHVHSFADVTEGGILGMTLLLHHHFHISPALSGLILNVLCYLFGMHSLGKRFLILSMISGGLFSAFYAFFEQFDPIFPTIAEHPLIAAIIGGIFVGVGVGLCVTSQAAPSGDDALALSLSHILHVDIRWIYLVTDLSVLLLSLTYIPLHKILYSLITVIISGQIIGWIQKFLSSIFCKNSTKKN